MAQDVSPIERLAERAISLRPADIEAEFTRIWEETSGADTSSIRLRVLNFVGLGPELWTVDRWEFVMASLGARHPCRSILAVVSSDEQPLEASISAHCWRAQGGGRHVCSEEVLLRGGQAHTRALASTVLALLVPELPMYVWLIGDIDFRSPLVAPLIDEADAVFVDTADNFDAYEGLRSAMRAHTEYDVRVRDLAWQRSAAWRGLLAQFFDGDDGARRLDQLTRISVVGGAGGPSSDALLMAGWFISRLDMSLASLTVSASGLEATLYESTRGVDLVVQASSESERLESVVLTVGAATFTVATHKASAHIHVREDWPDAEYHRTVEQQPVDDASLFMTAIDDHHDADVFLEALAAAVTLLDEP